MKVAVFDDFLESYAKLPRPQQRKVSEFLRKFRENPTSPAINYEKIADFRDPNLRTVRIDLSWRAIVLKPERGDVFVLLWVDHHDEAMAWARNRRVEIHPDTGALQVFAGVTVTEAVVQPTSPTPDAPAPIFEAFRDRELVRLGVPEGALPGVRAVRTRAALDALRPALPADAFESLGWLADGEPYADVERIVAEASAPTPLPAADFAAALQTSASQRSFVLVEDDASLAAMLDAPLAKWRVFLHPSQRKLVETSASGPVRVLGGAGTGKTVVAMHRAVWLARHACPGPDDRVLFTTFTRNLALDIGQNLDVLAPSRARIEVTPIDVLVTDLLKRAGYGRRVAYWGASDGRLAGLWKQALTERPSDFDQPESFYRDEWELVVLPQACRTWEAYRDATRSGRGVRLSRAQRQAIWPVFGRYRALLDRAGLAEPEDAFLDAVGLVRDQPSLGGWRSVIVDESQDMSTAAFRFLRALVPEGPNDIFLVGDGHQRIYRRRVVLSQAGVHVRGRAHRLRINYRTTEEIRRFAAALLACREVDDLDGEADTLKGYRSLTTGRAPEIRAFETFEAEADALAAWVREDDPQRTCLVARTHELRDRYAAALRARGLETMELNDKTIEKADAPGLRVATMHRVKGLEFDRVVLAGAVEGQVPFQRELERSNDEAVREDAEAQERALAYVALTRARKAALVTATGRLSGWFGGAG